MLIARKNSNLKKIIIDFRFLNSRLQRINLAFLLMTDAFAILGSSKFECLSVSDLRDTYHIFKLSESSRSYCGILVLPCSCIYYYAIAYNTPKTQNYDCLSYDIRRNPK